MTFLSSFFLPPERLDHLAGTNKSSFPMSPVVQSSVSESFFFLFLKGFIYLFLKGFIYLFLERGEGKEKERERNIHVWLPLMALHWGPVLTGN